MIVLKLNKGRQGPVSLNRVALLVGHNSVSPETFERVKTHPLFEQLVSVGALEVIYPEPEPEVFGDEPTLEPVSTSEPEKPKPAPKPSSKKKSTKKKRGRPPKKKTETE